MSFDKEQVLQQISNILSRTPAPGGAASLEAAGWVERVIARDGQVHFVVNPPPDQKHEAAAVRRTLEEQVGAIPGVTQVQVLEKAQQGAPATTPAPGLAAGAEQLPGVRHIIAVASGKGGVGKSTVAVNLAVELARKGQKVGLLDSDVYGPSIPKMLGLEGAHPKVVGKERIVPVESHGVHTISIGFLLDEDAPVIWRGPMVTGLLRQFLFQVEWGDLDYLIIDMPPGTGDAQLTLVQSVA
ncbi:MAG: P-loop NTPase, partial [Planctomycetota bacterium]